jgi:hypothetical protein
MLCEVQKELENVSVIVAISSFSADGQRILHLNSQDDGPAMHLMAGTSEIQLRLPALGLVSRVVRGENRGGTELNPRSRRG